MSTNTSENNPERTGEIVIVDDNLQNLHLLSNVLTRAGYRVRAARDGQYAIDTIRKNPPDLILLDVRMPVMNGHEVCRTLKDDPSTQSIPVIFISAATEADDQVIGFEVGAVDYISKPIRVPEVLARVHTHISLAKAQKQLQTTNETLEERVLNRTQELTLALSELKMAQKVAEIGSWNLDVKSNLLTWSEETYRLFGVAQGTPLNYEMFISYIHPSDRSNADAAWQEALKGAPYDVEHRIIVDGQERWVHEKAVLEFGADEQLLVGNGTVQNITIRKTLEKQFQQAQKMEAVGQLAGGVAHDFNNLLMIILGGAEIIQMEEEQMSSTSMEMLTGILQAAESAKNLTRQLLLFSRRSDVEKKNLSLNHTVSDMLKMMARLLEEGIALTYTANAEADLVFADAGQIEQIVMNLCVNARDAMDGQGDISMSTSSVCVDSVPSEFPDAVPGNYVCLTISDNGEGIPAAIRERIFEPFFTTKEEGKGTGLGLATVYGIIRDHGGFITIDSTPEQGTSFNVCFPRIEDESTRTEEAPVSLSQQPQRALNILLIDDRDDILEMTGIILKAAGHTVHVARDGLSASQIFAKLRDDIDMVVLDLILPGKSGRDLFREFRKQCPSLPIVFMTGYVGNSPIATEMDDKCRLLIKPFTRIQLVNAVNQISH